MSTLTEELEVCRYCEGGAAMSPAECPECEGEVMVRYEKQADPLSSGTDRHQTTLQREADAIDCDLHRLVTRLERLADTIRVAGPKLRGVANKVHDARIGIRQFMHASDRNGTEG